MRKPAWLRRRHAVRTWFGWPVESAVRRASHTKLRNLIAQAAAEGFSRRADGLEVDDFADFILVPYLIESSPVLSWMCVVMALGKAPALGGGEHRPKIHYARLDVAESEWKGLPEVAPWEHEQLVVWLAWEAYRGHRNGPTERAH